MNEDKRQKAAAREERALIHQYESGYRKKPEGEFEIKAAEITAVTLLAAGKNLRWQM
jgi:hypothetical protein